jgi:hypothetical protein
MNAILLSFALLLCFLPGPAHSAADAIDMNVSRLRIELDALRRQNAAQLDELARLRAGTPATSTESSFFKPWRGTDSTSPPLDRLAELEAAIKRGEDVSGILRRHIANLESETKRLNDEKQQLLQIQTALTSGLVGALVTTAIAIVGAITSYRRSRADRDFRRLEVIEKTLSFVQNGHYVPADIISAYLGGSRPRTSGQNLGQQTKPGEEG